MNLLTQETTRQLLGFGMGVLPTADFEEWVIAVQDDEMFPETERDALGQLRLLLLECDEGQREIGEIRAFAWGLLENNGATTFSTNSNETAQVQSITYLAAPAGRVAAL